MKQKLLDIAEVVDGFRVIPRLIVIAYIVLLWKVGIWFMSLDAAGVPHTTFVSTIVGIAGVIVGFYLKTGRNWLIGKEKVDGDS